MFIGHYSAAFVAKRVAPGLPLSAYFIACQTIDLFWGSLVLAGVEKLRVIPNFTASNGLDLYYMPYTHSLPAALIWSFLAAALFWICMPRTAQRVRTAIVIGLVVATHWLFDLLVHVPDLPLWFDSMKVGLGWWNYRTFALLLELVMLWGAVWLSLPAAAGKRYHYLLLAVLMSGVQVFSAVRQPDRADIVAMQLLAAYLLFTSLAWWVDRRSPAPN
jgi:hypothetical protein